MKPLKPESRYFFLFSILLIASLLTLGFIIEARFLRLLRFAQCAVSNVLPPMSLIPSLEELVPGDRNSSFLPSSSSDELRILIGILTIPKENLRRHLLRLVYRAQSPVRAKVDIKYVFCNVTEEDQKFLMKLEILSHDDIIVLNCTENMNSGKTYTYFSSLPDLFKDNYDGPFPPYHYVMKTDDDTFLRLNRLVELLQTMPRDDFYFGFMAPPRRKRTDPFNTYMSGMGYLVSWDIVEWIRESEIPKKHQVGPEDIIFGKWMKEGHKAVHRRDSDWSIYDHPRYHGRWTFPHELWPDTIAVHKLKSHELWISTLTYFNITQNFKPSKFYPS